MYKILILNMVEICTTQKCSSVLHNFVTGLRFFFGGRLSYEYKWLRNAPFWYRSTTTASAKNSGWMQLIVHICPALQDFRGNIAQWRRYATFHMFYSAFSHYQQFSENIQSVLCLKNCSQHNQYMIWYESMCKLPIHHVTVLPENHEAMYINPIQM